ncbi:transposase [Paraburkholderia panacisoli]|jgi:transposase|uniref:transposase n=1 Tax=Paraburkholderia panacisoli TaxID=2603818 RepID=UPI001FE55B32|nr:transposase [Paraburkholderia panacisoli]
MSEDRDLRSRLVVGAKRDGRREYDPQARDELIQLCMKPGVSIARTAMEYGVNPNLLREWITRYQKAQATGNPVEKELTRPDGVSIDVTQPAMRTRVPGVPSSFIPVVQEPVTVGQTVFPRGSSITVALHVRLPNGVEFDIADATIDELTTVVQMLGRMPCSGSTTI